MLRGEHVTLRPFERSDLPQLQLLRQNVDLVIAVNGHWQPDTLARLEYKFDKQQQDDEFHDFAIVVEDRLIGRVMLFNLNRRDRTAELGIGILDPAAVGQSYGRETIGLVLDYAFRIQNYQRVWLTVDATNTRAVRSYQASGFVEEGRLRRHFYTAGSYIDGLIMGVLREEWAARVGPAASRSVYPEPRPRSE